MSDALERGRMTVYVKRLSITNILSHRYNKLDLDLLWTIANEDVPKVLNIILELKSRLIGFIAHIIKKTG